MYTVEIPSWVLSNIGGFVGFVILSGVIFKYLANKKEQNKIHAERMIKAEERRESEVKLCFQEQDQLKKEKLDVLLPGPWRTLYDFLYGHPDMTRQSLLLAILDFKKSNDLPIICPAGFDLILEGSYYNLGVAEGEEGSCHDEFTSLFEDYVKFPK